MSTPGEDVPLSPGENFPVRDTPVPAIPEVVQEFAEHDPPVSNLAPRASVRDGGDPNAVLTFKFQPEACRFIAYIGFWTMCILAIILTNTVVGPYLEKGPNPDEPFCPPFETGVGFDIATNSHLVRTFGFNNVSYIIPHPREKLFFVQQNLEFLSLEYVLFLMPFCFVLQFLSNFFFLHRFVPIGIILHRGRLRQHIIRSLSILF
jgi:hypothetical protein